MVFVDDFLAAYHRKESKHAHQIKDLLSQRFEMKDYGELTQFIGVRVIRDRKNRKAWINQSAYIEKITDKYNLIGKKPP